MFTTLSVLILILLPMTSAQLIDDSEEIKGRVVDEESNPMGGVDVVLVGTHEYKQSTVTDETGSFSLPGLVPAHYELTISKLGYRSLPDDKLSLNITLAPGEGSWVSWKLIPCRGCFGTVLDPRGAPVYFASVMAILLNSPGADRVHTNRLGRFHFDSLQPDPVHITSYHPKYDPIRRVAIAEERHSNTFQFHEPAQLLVHLLVPENATMPQHVRLLAPGVPYRSKSLSMGARVVDGQATVTYPHGRTIVVSAMSPGFERTLPKSVNLIAGETRELTFELRPNWATRFELVDEEGMKLQGVKVSVRGLKEKSTDENGVVKFHFLSPPSPITFEKLAFGTVILDEFAHQFEFHPRLVDELVRVVMVRNRVDAENPSVAPETVFTANPKVTTFVGIDSPEETFTVSGIVTDLDSSPIPFCLVMLEGFGQMYADSQGRFTFGKVPCGLYVLQVQDLPEPLVVRPKELNIVADISDINVQTCVGRWIQFRADRGYYGRIVSPTPKSHLRDGGQFKLLLPPGAHRMTILMSGVEDREGYMGTAVAYAEIDAGTILKDEKDEVVHNVSLVEAYSVRFVFRSSNKRVLRNVSYSIEAPRNSKRAAPIILGRTGSDGFGNQFLPRGPYVVRATLPDGIELRARIAVARIDEWESLSHSKNSFVFSDS